MSPIVYVPPKKHECEPPRQNDLTPHDSGEGWYPKGTVWECDKCSSRWKLEYSPREILWCGSTYSYYEVYWCMM